MKITSKRDIYNVKWAPAGWSCAVPIVRKQRKLFGISYWKKVWEGPSRGLIEAEKMFPDAMEKWFMSAVIEYENYSDAWNGNTK